MEKRELVNAVCIIRGRLATMAVESKAAAEAARLVGQSQMRALLANAPERLRVSSILPCLPDNLPGYDRLRDRLKVLHGQPSELMCPLLERETMCT